MKKILRQISLFLGLCSCSLLLSGCALSDITQKSGLQVISSNVPSSIYLDGKYLNKTPYINKEIKAGDYTVALHPDDPTLASYETKISLKPGILSVVIWKPGTRPETSGGVTYEMEKLPYSKKSELSLITIPDSGIIRVDDQNKGFAPILVENISPGEHQYEVTLPSYEGQNHTINVLEGYRMNVTVKLAKLNLVPTQSPQASASASAATASATIKIKSTGFFLNGQEVVKVRDAPNAFSNEVGTAAVGTVYPYKQISVDGWYKIEFNVKDGWVSEHFAQLLP